MRQFSIADLGLSIGSRAIFIAALALSVVGAPLAADAQSPGKVPRIGILSPYSPSTPSAPSPFDFFLQGLRDLGYVEGRNIGIEWRYAEGRDDRLRDLAAELVRLKVDMIVTTGTPGILATKNATDTIPIVFAAAADPVGSGLVTSLARPGGNITGLSNLALDLSAKRVELLKEILPTISRVAVVWNAGNPAMAQRFRETQAAARALGVTYQSLEVQEPKDIEQALSAITRERVDALLVLLDAFTIYHRGRIADLAVRSRLPMMGESVLFAEAGGLMTYGSNPRNNFRRAAVYVDKILRGAKPGDLPVEQPTRIELIINLKTAKALGLTIPQSVLIRADQVIQ